MSNPNIDILKQIPGALNSALAGVLGASTNYAEKTVLAGQIQCVVYVSNSTPTTQIVNFNVRVEAGYGSLTEANAGAMSLIGMLGGNAGALVNSANAVVTDANPITSTNIEDANLGVVIVAPIQEVQGRQAQNWIVILTTDLEVKTAALLVCR